MPAGSGEGFKRTSSQPASTTAANGPGQHLAHGQDDDLLLLRVCGLKTVRLRAPGSPRTSEVAGKSMRVPAHKAASI